MKKNIQESSTRTTTRNVRRETREALYEFLLTITEEPLDYKSMKSGDRDYVNQQAKAFILSKEMIGIVSSLIDTWKEKLVVSDADMSEIYRGKILGMRDFVTTLRAYAANIKKEQTK